MKDRNTEFKMSPVHVVFLHGWDFLYITVFIYIIFLLSVPGMGTQINPQNICGLPVRLLHLLLVPRGSRGAC